MNHKNVITVSITRITPDSRAKVQDYLVGEEKWGLAANGEMVAELNCLPSDLEQLAAGHLFCLGRLRRADEIAKMDIDREGKKVSLTLEPAARPDRRPPDEDGLALAASDINRLQREFNERCELFRRTGAVHSVALADKDGLLVFFEDVARHNALDKVIGEMVLRGLSPVNKVLIFSGRLAADMLQKICAIGVKLLIAPGAPTAAGVSMAGENGITLLGFVRKDNINIYTHEHRIES
jgi:FdhD protein